MFHSPNILAERAAGRLKPAKMKLKETRPHAVDQNYAIMGIVIE